MAAFCLDTLIQKQSAGRKNLKDLLRFMMNRYGLTVATIWESLVTKHLFTAFAGTII